MSGTDKPSSMLIFDEIEEHIRRGNSTQRVEMLRRISSLFLQGAGGFSEPHVEFFDDVFEKLVANVEERALAELSFDLAAVDNAPRGLVGRLARNDAIDISGPLLERSTRLTDTDLKEVALTKSQAHLMAIAGRRTINPLVTDVLVRRGDDAVATRVAGNGGAIFSPDGLAKLMQRGEQCASIAEKIAQRTDVASEHFSKMIARASEQVIQRLLQNPNPAIQARVQEILPMLSEKVARMAKTAAQAIPRATAYDPLEEEISQLAALSSMQRDVVAHLVRQKNEDGVLILCKAAQMGWLQTRDFLTAAKIRNADTDADMRDSFNKYLKLSAETAQRVIRFMRAQKALSDDDVKRLLRDHSGLKGGG